MAQYVLRMHSLAFTFQHFVEDGTPLNYLSALQMHHLVFKSQQMKLWGDYVALAGYGVLLRVNWIWGTFEILWGMG